MDLITLGRTLGFSFAAGVNLYATVAILGLASRYGWVSLPPQFQAFNNDIVIGAAVVMYLIEFFADKIPYVDSLWDVIHTAIRPVGGALIAVTTLGEARTEVLVVEDQLARGALELRPEVPSPPADDRIGAAVPQPEPPSPHCAPPQAGAGRRQPRLPRTRQTATPRPVRREMS